MLDVARTKTVKPVSASIDDKSIKMPITASPPLTNAEKTKNRDTDDFIRVWRLNILDTTNALKTGAVYRVRAVGFRF